MTRSLRPSTRRGRCEDGSGAHPRCPCGSKGSLAVKLAQSLNGAGPAAQLSPPLREQTWEWPDGSRVDQLEIGQVGVVGLGTTGAALAELCLRAGVETVGCELS